MVLYIIYWGHVTDSLTYEQRNNSYKTKYETLWLYSTKMIKCYDDCCSCFICKCCCIILKLFPVTVFMKSHIICLIFVPQVAQHLASTYGGKAFDVAKMAQVTGQRWPIVGKRLVSEFPYIESEVTPDFINAEQVSRFKCSLTWVVFFFRCCTRLRSTPARPSTSSHGEPVWAFWTCRRPMRRCHASCRSWGRSWTGVRSGRRYNFIL